MSAVLMSNQSFSLSHLPSCSSWRNFTAAGVAVGIHALVVALLLAQWPSSKPEAPQVRTLTTQLISLPAPAPPALPEMIAPPPEPASVADVPPIKPVEPIIDATPEPQIQQQKLEQAALARKRVEEQQQRELQKAQQREQQRLAEQRRLERQRREAQQAETQQRLAQEQARQAHEAAAVAARQAEAAAAASRQYLPIAKEAPDYPDRALDKNIEGDCTVSYRVNSQGRVESPEVVGDCHPLFVRPSLAAAKTFRYQPRLENGKAVAVDGVKNTFHYRIE
ncbi:energy transducer TonB [Pseudomonas sp. EL_65y_Pfl2_R95]|uniref:energy transducer TonB n=1 Tax=Pseudomonas sp. EL_65y_Pfl2_R95 TaxID=3088698 RepID=UPI0030DA3E30